MSEGEKPAWDDEAAANPHVFSSLDDLVRLAAKRGCALAFGAGPGAEYTLAREGPIDELLGVATMVRGWIEKHKACVAPSDLCLKSIAREIGSRYRASIVLGLDAGEVWFYASGSQPARLGLATALVLALTMDLVDMDVISDDEED